MSNITHIQGFMQGEWQSNATESFELRDKFTDELAATVAISDADAVVGAVKYLATHRKNVALSPRERAQVLLRAAQLIRQKRESLIEIVQIDTGFARGDAVKEVDRSADTLTLCAEEATRLVGTLFPVDSPSGSVSKHSYSRLEPVGIVCALTPFNSPMNTVAHKVGPAIAAGNSVILKPASQTPWAAAQLVEILLEAGLPKEMIALVYGSGAAMGSVLTAQPEIDYFAFTGSTQVGEQLHAAVGLRPAQLEMGSIASTVVCHDADLDAAAAAITAGALRKSGQVCTSVQRVFADERITEALAEKVTAAMSLEVAGDPSDAKTTVGPLISRSEAERVELWINEAVAAGAQVRCGGTREGSVVQPTLLTGVPDTEKLMTQELFGPAVVMRSFTSLPEAYDLVNNTEYGLAAGIFTNSLQTAFEAAERIDVGAFYVNQTSASRMDPMRFAGVKASGFGGAEGPAFAIRDMSVERVITITP